MMIVSREVICCESSLDDACKCRERIIKDHSHKDTKLTTSTVAPLTISVSEQKLIFYKKIKDYILLSRFLSYPCVNRRWNNHLCYT